MTSGRAGEAPVPATVSRILISRLWPFGDAFLATSFLEALKERYPSARITFLIAEAFRIIAERHPCVDEILTVPTYRGIRLYAALPRLLSRIRACRFDLVLDQQGSTTTRLLTVLSGATTTIGMDRGAFTNRLTIAASSGRYGPSYAAYRNFDLVTPLDIHPRLPLRMHFTLTEEDRRFAATVREAHRLSSDGYVIIAPGSKSPHKQWGMESFAELAGRIRDELGLGVVVAAAPDERPVAKAVARLAGEGVHVAPPTTLPQAVALVENARLLVCNDCALNHLSTTTATPTLALFGPSHPSWWSPASAFAGKRHLYKSIPERDPAVSFGITVNEAFEAARDLTGGSSL